MTGRLLIHVGLPKTATTTLQAQYFPWLEEEGCIYLGTLQPRGRQQDPLFVRLRDAVMRRPEDLAHVREELATLLAAGSHVVASEEMFLVSGAVTESWKIKLGRLSSLVRGLDYMILVTVREPCSGSFSYYVELEPRYRSLDMSYVTAVQKDDAMQIYNYSTLLEALDSFFQRDRIRFLQFDEIVAGRWSSLDGLLDVTTSQRLPTPVPMNSRRTNSVGEVMTGRTLTLADMVRQTSLARWLRRIMAGSQAFIALRSMLRRLDALSWSERKVKPPSANERAQVAQLLLPGWEVLKERMGAHV